jgi:DeoR/GlpR family transcriptional regulator of sugar metabolism
MVRNWLEMAFNSKFLHLDGMGFFDQLILDSLKDSSPKSFKEFLAGCGLSHNTLKRYLRRLMNQGLVLRKGKSKIRVVDPNTATV